ncbi:MAG: DUF935 family protein [Sphingomonas sp.]|nr:DUF935 family protein [Sphingomonas sp.]
MSFLDRIRERAGQFLAVTKPQVGERSLSGQRARDRIAIGFMGAAMGRRMQNDDLILTNHGSGDIKLWKDILDDDRCYSCFQQRRLAVVSRPWEVEPGADDPQSKRAAEFISYTIKQIGWDRVCERMLFGVWYGYGVAEAVYRIEPEGEWAGLIGLDRIDVPDRAWFGFGAEGDLRIIDPMGLRDEPVPERKFWFYAAGGDHDFLPYGVGLAHWLFWPVFFKRQGLPFWLRFLEKFGTPTVMGKVQSGKLDDPTERSKVVDVLRSVMSDSAIAVPDWLEMDLLDASRSGAGGYELLLDRMDQSITRVILSQTMTTEDGSSRSQAEVHMDVRDEVVRSDSDLLHESFNRSFATWLTEFNFPGAKPPRVYRIMDEPEDLQEVADRDTTLKALGWERTDESFAEIYGEGYERKEQAPPPEITPGIGQPKPPEFTAEDVDAIDRMVSAMADAGNDAVTAFVAPLRAKLKGVDNPEVLRIALLDHLESMDPKALREALGNTAFAVRAASEAGVDLDDLGVKNQTLFAFNPNQPRIPGGEGGGQWTKEGSAGAASKFSPKWDMNGIDPSEVIENGNISREERKALKNYSKFAYFETNKELRAGAEPASVGAIDAAIDGSLTTEDTLLFRGVEGPVPRQGDTLLDLGYSSTSTSPATAANFSEGYLMSIRMPAGESALSMDAQLSVFPEEKEVLLPRGSGFRVVGHSSISLHPITLGMESPHANDYAVVKVEYVPPEPRD